VLRQLGQMGVAADSLATLHRSCDSARALDLARQVTLSSAAPEPRRLLERAVREAIPEIPAARIWLQTHAHIRFLFPGDTRAPFPTHSDHGFGHGLHERNLWLSLTDAQGDGALHLLSLEASLAWMCRSGRVRGVLDDAPGLSPVPTLAGEVLLFTPLHLHQSRPPAPPFTRVSIDVRIIPRPTHAQDLSFSPFQGVA
jgi:hypothetical protein